MADEPVVETNNLTRSCNEALILASLRQDAKHGYQLALDIEQRGRGSFRFQHGTLYPILHKLEKKGLIRGAWSKGSKKRKRKSYELTSAGRRYAARQLESWHAFIDEFLIAVGGEGP